jgi:hypothetical protein
VSAPSSAPSSSPTALQELVQWPQWVTFRLEPRDGKVEKIPYNPRTGGAGSHSNPATWADFQTACAALPRYGHAGVGFVFTASDLFVGIDLDECRDPETKVIEDWAHAIIDYFASYTEISVSGTGVHILVQGTLPPGRRKRGRIEMYDRTRFFAMTGDQLPGTPDRIMERSEELRHWHAAVFPGAPKPSPPTADSHDGGAGSAAPLSPAQRQRYEEAQDRALLHQAREAANGDKFIALFDRGECHEYLSRSEADLALVSHLAFWTGPYPALIDRLFRQSKLYREKWDRIDYRTATIRKVLDAPDFRSYHDPLPADEAPAASDASHASQEMPASSSPGKKGPQSQADRLIAIADVATLFHTPDGTGYARVPVGEHVETWGVRGPSFRRWLSRRFYIKTQKTPSAQAMTDALRHLEARAQFDGDTRDVFVRVGRLDDALYVDLANAEWQAIKITRAGWQVVSQPPIAFRRARGMLPLPLPQSGGSLDALREHINLGPDDDDDWRLVAGWEVGALHPTGPYPVLAMHAEQGAAKSTTQRLLRALLDPNTAPLRAEPRDGRDLIIAANNGWIVALDNVSHLSAWLSDALCRLSTGGGFATRELYTDAEEMIFEATRPILLNGIAEIITRGDLLDRAIIVYLPQILDAHRREEREIHAAFAAAHPQMLGALLDSAVCALKRQDEVHVARLPRMADFTLWVTAAEPALGWHEGAFAASYVENRGLGAELELEASSVALTLRALLSDAPDKRWQGTTKQLLGALTTRVGAAAAQVRSWPRTPQALSGQLRRLGPTLRATGITIEGEKDSRKRVKLLTIQLEPANHRSHLSQGSQAPVPPSNASVAASAAASAARPPVSSRNLKSSSDASDASDEMPPLSGKPTSNPQQCDSMEEEPEEEGVYEVLDFPLVPAALEDDPAADESAPADVPQADAPSALADEFHLADVPDPDDDASSAQDGIVVADVPRPPAATHERAWPWPPESPPWPPAFVARYQTWLHLLTPPLA